MFSLWGEHRVWLSKRKSSMKKYVALLVFLAFFITANAQEKYQFKEVNHIVNKDVRYKLYPTFNMWTYLKLDTKTGDITQVQYSTDDDDMEVYLGAPEKIIADSVSVNGRYELYPTSNNWTFILLDQIDGDVYHVQWNQKRDNRMILKINYALFR